MVEIFECKICCYKDENDEIKRSIIEKDTSCDKFWKEINKHMLGKKHMDNVQNFISNI